MESQLHNIYDEDIQRKRVGKQISLLTSNDQLKTLLSHRLTYIRKQQLIFHISLKPAYFSKHKLDPSLSPLSLKVIYTNSYPYMPPRLYFISENINQLYTVLGRDYFREVCPHWTTKTQIMDIIPSIAVFLAGIAREERQHMIGKYNRGEFIEMEPLYTLKASEFYPIRVIINQKPESAFLIINRFDFILLENSSVLNYLRLVDAYSLSCIKYILRSKRTEKKVLLMLKVMGNEFGLEFLSDDHDNIVQSIIQKKRTAPVYDEEAQANQKQEEQNEIKQEPVAKISLEQLNQQIVIFESLLDKDFSETVVKNLIQLYKKAIEICSAASLETYKFYLNKLQDLLANEAVQFLMNSTLEQQNNGSIFSGLELPKQQPRPPPLVELPKPQTKQSKSQDDLIEFFADTSQPEPPKVETIDLL